MPAKTAKDIMTTRVVTVKPSTSVEDAARLLVRRKISGVPVVDEKDKTKVGRHRDRSGLARCSLWG